MKSGAIFRILGLFLMMFSFSMLPPAFVSLYFADASESIFLISFALTFSNGILLWFPFRHHIQELNTRDGFLVVVLFWIVLSLYGTLPFLMTKEPQINFIHALFETISGLTTTGASVLSHLDTMPFGLRYYRQQLQFLGGMGVVVLAIAIMPILGIGGMQLYRAEVPGPFKESKLTPKITATAKILWFIYVFLTVICAITYWLSGMSWFEAIGESFATVSTGGFSLHDLSFSYYASHPGVLYAGIFFMLVGSINFTLHYLAWKQKSLKVYLKDSEFKGFFSILFIVIFLVLLGLWMYKVYNQPGTELLHTLFDVISMVSTTGYYSDPFGYWPTYIPFLIMSAALIGGCAGSTAGGIKVIRFILLNKQIYKEMRHIIHPNALIPIKFGHQIFPESIIQAIWSFISLYFLLFAILLLLLIATGLDFTTAFGALSACISNSGAGIGQVSTSFSSLNDPAKWILSFTMLAGRLEMFTIFVLFVPEFWRA